MYVIMHYLCNIKTYTMEIKEVIRAKGYSVSQAAERMGITRVSLEQSISRNLTIGTLRRIAAAIGCNVIDFFADEQPDAKLLRKPKTLCPYCGKPIRIELSKAE